MPEQGHISINTENILPIIKRWLYAEQEIFLRELVANATDAITKLEKLCLMGEAKDAADALISVDVDSKDKTIKITDTGLGMTAEEIKKYINDVAFSGVQDFVSKYQGKDEQSQIIGHFGLGFYSAFMIAERVEIDSLSCSEGAKAAHWECAGDTAFTLSESSRKEVGTTITLHVGEDAKEMLEAAKLREVINKYCRFMRYPIHLNGELVNEPQPIWTKSPTELKDEDYQGFYERVFPLSGKPLFWIHLNVDYPFKLRGVLYFPKLSHEFEAAQGEVKLYCNQVFVADNAKELIPEYLTLLKGVIDCPDLPLNVSRSYLQKDPYVRKISEHITKKVADRLTGMAKTDRENYEKHWEDIGGFVKYSMLRDQKFFDRMQEYVLFKSSDGGYLTVAEYLERCGEKSDGKLIYTSDEVAQAAYISMLKSLGIEVVVASTMLDKHFLPYLEMHSKGNKLQFARVDADVSKHLLDAASESNIVDPSDNKKPSEKLQELFTRYLDKEKVQVRVENLKATNIAAVLVLDENQRRMREMAEMMPGHFVGFDQLGTSEPTLVVNASCPAVKSVLNLSRGISKEDDIKLIVNQIYDLAYLQQGRFSPGEMQTFIDRSVSMMGRLGGL